MPEVIQKPTLATALFTLDVLADAVLLVEHKRRIIYMNAASRALFKAARIDTKLLHVGSDFLSEFPAAFPGTAELRAQLGEWLDKALSGTPPSLKNIYDSSLAGREYVFEIQTANHPLDERPGALILLRDITQATRTTRALQESEQRFRLLTDMSSEAVLLSEGGVIVDGNAAVCKMLGYAHEELIGIGDRSGRARSGTAADPAGATRRTAPTIELPVSGLAHGPAGSR